MAKIKDFAEQASKKKTAHKKKKESKSVQMDLPAESDVVTSDHRRPGLDESVRLKAVDVDDSESEVSVQEQKMDSEQSSRPAESSAEENPKIEIHFQGSEILRAKAPQLFDLAESVLTDWVRDGEFQDLPVSNPALKRAAQQGLKKAKEMEKKMAPVAEKAAMKAFMLGLEAQKVVQQVRKKFEK